MSFMTITAGVIMSMYMDAAQNSESDYCYQSCCSTVCLRPVEGVVRGY